jgi:LDH2 family malate/lactate/ureidoglycolate dehydrogenase
VADAQRFRLDDLRRFGAALAAHYGVSIGRSLALAAHFLWYDSAGVPTLGIISLPDLLERLQAGTIDPAAEGAVVAERNGTAVLDAQGGIPALALARAMGIAAEKARDGGVGLVRVLNLTGPCATAGVTAETAAGPFAALVLGPGPGWTLALPTALGLPAVFDAAFAEGTEAAEPGAASIVPAWAAALAPGNGLLAAALSIEALEPLARFHHHVAAALDGLAQGARHLLPHNWDARRHQVREHGVEVAPEGWTRLQHWGRRLKVELPEPIPR